MRLNYTKKLMVFCPVAEFLDELEPKMWAKVSINIDILAEHNINLREPLVKRRNI